MIPPASGAAAAEPEGTRESVPERRLRQRMQRRRPRVGVEHPVDYLGDAMRRGRRARLGRSPATAVSESRFAVLACSSGSSPAHRAKRWRHWVAVFNARLCDLPGESLGGFGGFGDAASLGHEAWNIFSCDQVSAARQLFDVDPDGCFVHRVGGVVDVSLGELGVSLMLLRAPPLARSDGSGRFTATDRRLAAGDRLEVGVSGSGRMSSAVAISTHSPSRNSNASRVRSTGSTMPQVSHPLPRENRALAVQVELAGRGREHVAHPVGRQRAVRRVKEVRHPLAAPAGEIGHADVVAQVQLRFVDDPPSTVAAGRRGSKGPPILTPRDELARACGKAGRGLVWSTPSTVSATRVGRRIEHSPGRSPVAAGRNRAAAALCLPYSWRRASSLRPPLYATAAALDELDAHVGNPLTTLPLAPRARIWCAGGIGRGRSGRAIRRTAGPARIDLERPGSQR